VTPATTAEHVVLVDERNQPIGTAPKANVHMQQTPLHRGFSVFVLNDRGELLLQQRAATKKTWPLVWSNSCCGHPADGETNEAAATRRLSHELGLSVSEIQMVLPDYRYCAELNGVVENEFCPVMVAFTDQTPSMNPDEVEAIRWVPWDEFVVEVKADVNRYSPWCTEETLLLESSPHFQEFRQQHRKAG
jgi:isopentenyl-diphosphate delta-isomerase